MSMEANGFSAEAVVLEAVRTPVGRRGGALSAWHPVDLLGATIAELINRSGVEPALIDDVIAGCVLQADQQTGNMARHAVLAAGLPESVPAVTIDRQCGSGQQAVSFAAQAVMAGSQDLVVACGVEIDVPSADAAGDDAWRAPRSSVQPAGAGTLRRRGWLDGTGALVGTAEHHLRFHTR